MWLGLKPSKKTWYLVLGLNEAQVLNVSSQKEFIERQVRSGLTQTQRKHTPQTVQTFAEDECGPEMWWG